MFPTSLIAASVCACGAAFAFVGVAAATAPALLVDPVPCITEARKDANGKFYITCPVNADCTQTWSLYEYDYNQSGNDYYHFCACDDGTPIPDCTGFMLSHDPDPEEGGIDVGCVSPPSCPEPLEYCDEGQLTAGEAFIPLCVCKQQ